MIPAKNSRKIYSLVLSSQTEKLTKPAQKQYKTVLYGVENQEDYVAYHEGGTIWKPPDCLVE